MTSKQEKNEVLEVIRALYARRYLVVIVGILGVAVGVGVELLLRVPAYEAEMELVYSSPRLGDEGMASYMPRQLHALDIKSIFESTNVMGSALDTLIAEGLWADELEPPDLNDFSGKLAFSVATLDQTTRPVNYSPVFSLTAVAKDPEIAERMVNAWSDAGIAASQEAITNGVIPAAELMKSESEKAQSNFQNLLDALAADEAEYNTAILELELASIIEQLASVRNDTYDAERSLASSLQQLAVAQESLASERPTVDLFHAPSDDVYWLKEETKAAGSEQELQGKGMLRQSVNPVFVELRASENSALLNIAGAKARIAELNDQYAAIEAERVRIQKELATHSGIQRMLKQQANSAEILYNQLIETQSNVEAVINIGLRPDDDARIPFGVNRLSDRTYTREATSRIPGAAMALLYGVAAAGLMCLWIVYASVIVPIARSGDSDVFV